MKGGNAASSGGVADHPLATQVRRRMPTPLHLRAAIRIEYSIAGMLPINSGLATAIRSRSQRTPSNRQVDMISSQKKERRSFFADKMFGRIQFSGTGRRRRRPSGSSGPIAGARSGP